MTWLLLALAFVTVQPKPAEHARTLSNKRVRLERKAEVPVPPPPPGATSSTQVPINSSVIDSAGRKITFTGVLTMTVEDPPPPLVPVIAGVRAAGGTAFVTEALSGAPLELVGAGLPTSGQLRLTVGDKTATVRLWTPTLVQFSAPVVTAPVTAPVTLWQQVNNNWTVAAKGPTLTLRPGTVEVPALPRVDRFLALDGTAPAAFTIHQPLILQGTGFGTAKGRVLVNWLDVPVTAWSNERIETTAGDGTDPDGMQVQVKTPQGWLHARGPKVTMP